MRAGWRLSRATGINEDGQIAATAIRDGIAYAVRLDPVPEPATVGMLLAGLGMVGALGRRRQGSQRMAAPCVPAHGGAVSP